MLITADLRKYIAGMYVAIILVLAASIHSFFFPHIYDKKVEILSGHQESTLIPAMNRAGLVSLQVHIDYAEPQSKKVRVFSNGCIQNISLNSRNVPLDKARICRFLNGVVIDLEGWLIQGHNFLEVVSVQPEFPIADFNSPLIHVTFLPPHDVTFSFVQSALLACVVGLLILLMSALMADYISGFLLSGAFLLFAYWFMQTDFMQYTMDMPGHLQYISYIAEYWKLPATRDGWVFYHAPLYYILQAGVLVLGNYIGSYDPINMLRIFNLLCFLLFLIFSALTLRLLIKNRLAYYVALAFLLFYPSGILFSSRIDSHLLVYVWYAGASYFLLRWINEWRAAWLGLALGFLGIGIATRTNMYVLFPLFMVAMGYKWQQKRGESGYLRRPLMWVGVIILIVGFAISNGRPYYYNHFVYNDSPPKLGNLDRFGSGFIVKNEIENFLYFDVQTYLSEPFWHVLKDETGRQYFWNSMLKTSLFGEFKFGHSVIAKTMSMLLLWIIIYQLYGVLVDWKYYLTYREWWICLLLLGVPMVALMYSRWLTAYACAQDFRYIYPALVGFCGMLGLTIERGLDKKKYPIPAITAASMVVFSYYSIKFFLLQ